MARQEGADSRAMSAEGDRVRQRRERLGLSMKELAAEAHMHRTTIAAIEDGQGSRRSSLVKLERTLSDLEAEAGIDAPPVEPSTEGGVIEFDIINDLGIHVVVKGSIRDAEALRRQVIATIHEIRSKGDTPT